MGLVLIIIIVLAVIAIQWLRRHPEILMKWLARRMQKRYERQMRDAQEDMYRRQQRQRQQQQQQQRQQPSGRQSSRRSRRRTGSVIPPEYAQDVEFTEVKVFTRTEEETTAPGTEYHESQVSDVEWEEVKVKGK